MAFVSCVYGGAGGDGGSNAELVWTNPSPDSAFAAQTVSIDLSEYDFAIIATKAKNTSLNEVTFDSEHNIETVDFTSSLVVPQGYIKGDTARKRSVSVGTTGITFGAGIAGDGTQDNNVAIPYKIYGSKQLTTPPSSFVEIQEGAVTGSASGTFTVTSQQGKAPKRVQVWRTDGTRAFTVWNSGSKPTHYLFSNYNDGPAWYAVGTAYAYACSIMSVGSTSITIGYPTAAAYGNDKPFEYAVEFE